jgi:thiol-disulfide isomerase/thioredoxin
MPSSKSNSNNSSKSSSKSSSSSGSSSRSMSKDNYYCLVFLALIAILFVIYYYTYKNNREPFSGTRNNRKASSSGSSGAPNLKASQGETVVALFYADWCPHCVAFKPDFLKAKSDMSGSQHKGKSLRLELVDCVENKTIASENSVSGFPTVKIFTDDNKSTEYSGERSYEGLKEYFD